MANVKLMELCSLETGCRQGRDEPLDPPVWVSALICSRKTEDFGGGWRIFALARFKRILVISLSRLPEQLCAPASSTYIRKLKYYLPHYIQNLGLMTSLDTVALVGPNGAGSPHLLKLLMGESWSVQSGTASDGQGYGCVCLAGLAEPSTFLDEPTNHLDIETIDAL
ncbi:ATP-binding cassette sub-family F member 2 [Lates japonicus]|uniref:ATP-binding cassette sub-family F member 2 n=1 Tax=Lates japonicus TaxID=270547 RepID=A0AAD3MIL4_LATJO|nr:ATP-binding cassette sub-family F member 2 [Lates japonicus]